MYRFPTVVMFCEGAGIAAARALIEAGTQPAGLSLKRRTDVRMYYRVSAASTSNSFDSAAVGCTSAPRLAPTAEALQRSRKTFTTVTLS